jgi:hypothetical protein
LSGNVTPAFQGEQVQRRPAFPRLRDLRLLGKKEKTVGPEKRYLA